MNKKSGGLNKLRTRKNFWWKLSVSLPVSQRFQDLLWRFESTGFSDDGNELHAYFNPDNIHFESLVKRLQSDPHYMNRMSVSRIPAEDWESGWKKHFRPVKVSQRFIVRPSWEAYRKKRDEIVLIIDPKMSFGTGTHETTQIMLRMMEKISFKEKSVLDAGTGTGILAIAASMLQARRIFGADVETESVLNARENIRKNKCRSGILIRKSSFTDMPPRWPKKFDIILANIQRSVLTPHLSCLKERIKPGGTVLLSGILKTEDEFFCGELDAAGWDVIRKKNKNEWMGYMVRSGKPEESDS